MINKISIEYFKSLEQVSIELGVLNVFVGANGSGKSNLLEAIGVLSAAADGKVNDQMLLQRGVRPGVPKLYKSAFPSGDKRQPSHIYFSAGTEKAHYDVSLNNPLEDPNPAWKFKTELLEAEGIKITSRGPNMRSNPNTENGLAALKLVELKEGDPALELMRELQNYVIYTPTKPVLRGVAPETQPRQPLGLSGGRLPEVIRELFLAKNTSEKIPKISGEARELINWATDYGWANAEQLPLSPSASSAQRVTLFKDRYMIPSRNILSGYDASEGALYILFLSALAAHPKTPPFLQ
jgi:energy-coupling factor transporter ATP-binding protein EcfA2